MIIDTHVHIGGKPFSNGSGISEMTEDMTLTALTRYNIDYALVSNCDSAEVDHEQKLFPQECQISQTDSLARMLQFARSHSDRMKVAVWVKPLTEGLTPQLEQMIRDNIDFIRAIKLHPFHSNVSPTDKRTLPYIELAKELGLSVVSHTGGCEAADPVHMYELAKMFPSVNMVMVHLGLGTDNAAAIGLLSKADNLYGDTTWVPMSSTIRAVRMGLADKIMFGSDSPIDGPDTYLHNKTGDRSIYQDYFYELPKLISHDEYEDIMWRNAVRVIGLKP